ncbi:MAG: hypothetical protein LBE12_17800 [Planctomycetaceae bacterium]|nr:hypothetical protein [Planctomycetaceae bacterium]
MRHYQLSTIHSQLLFCLFRAILMNTYLKGISKNQVNSGIYPALCI